MQYAVDASVVLKWFLPETYSDKADLLLNDFLHQGLGLKAPDHLVAEVGNTLWKRSVLTREISTAQAVGVRGNRFADRSWPRMNADKRKCRFAFIRVHSRPVKT